MASILLIEDDQFICALIAAYLTEREMTVVTSDHGEGGLKLFDHGRIDAVVLDLELPDIDGLTVLRRLRARSQVPVVVISSRDRLDERVEALEGGADDFLTKPFDPRELEVRIKVSLRRAVPIVARTPAASGDLCFEDWRLRRSRRDLLDPTGRPVSLTVAEYNLLTALLQSPQRALSRERLLDSISRGDEAPVDRSVDVLVSRLRRKLERDTRIPVYIKTVQGFGYMFGVAVQVAEEATGISAPVSARA